MVGVIWTRKNEPILVDVADLEWLSQYGWFLDARGRAVATIKRKPTRMHRLLLPDSPQVDHINHDPADNRRANLRAATAAQNLANRRKWAGCSSAHKGVSWHVRHKKWQARISVNKKRTTLGFFDSEQAAAAAYEAAAQAAYGEFAWSPQDWGTSQSLLQRYRG